VPPPPADDYARYAILADKNIFVRNRPPTRTITNRGPASPRRTEEAFLLTGFALQEGGRRVAFIENTATGTTQRLLPGDAIAGGKVVAVDFDSILFESGSRQVRVEIGRNLLGDRFTPASAGGGATNGAGGSTTAPAAAPGAPLPGDANLSAEEKMRLRRQQQMGGGATPGAAAPGR
jgi:hypothetical protein